MILVILSALMMLIPLVYWARMEKIHMELCEEYSYIKDRLETEKDLTEQERKNLEKRLSFLEYRLDIFL